MSAAIQQPRVALGHSGSLFQWLSSPRFWLLTVFVFSRLAYFAAGIRFDARPLDTFFQVFDPVLLRTRLLETSYYAHTYPPGYNIMLGVVLKLFPNHFVTAFHVLYMMFGVALLFSLYESLQAVGVGPVLSAVLASLFIISPECILYENFLAYEYPMLAMLCVAALWFYRLLQRPRVLLANAFFFLVAWLVFFRSIFHLFYFVLVAAAVIFLLPGHRKMLTLAAIVPFLLASATYAKNWKLYGQFPSSSWMGFNIYTITTHQLTNAEMEAFIREGKFRRWKRWRPWDHSRSIVILSPYLLRPAFRFSTSSGIPPTGPISINWATFNCRESISKTESFCFCITLSRMCVPASKRGSRTFCRPRTSSFLKNTSSHLQVRSLCQRRRVWPITGSLRQKRPA